MPRAEHLVHAVVEPEPGNWSPKFPGERARHSVSRTISSSTLGFGLRSGTPSGRRPGQRADLHKVRLGQARRRSPIPLCARRSEVEGLPDSSAWAPCTRLTTSSMGRHQWLGDRAGRVPSALFGGSEGRGAEDLDGAGGVGSFAHPVEVDGWGWGAGSGRFAGLPVEGLPTARSLQAQHPRVR